MKEIEKTSINGWSINPPEDAQKVRRWLETIEKSSARQNLSAGSRAGKKTVSQEKLKF